MYIYEICPGFFLLLRNLSDKCCRGNQVHIKCSILFPKIVRFVKLGLMWKKFGWIRLAKDDNIIWHMRFASWITKTRIHTQNHYISYIYEFRYKKGYMNRPKSYVVITLPPLLLLSFMVDFIRTSKKEEPALTAYWYSSWLGWFCVWKTTQWITIR